MVKELMICPSCGKIYFQSSPPESCINCGDTITGIGEEISIKLLTP